VLFGTALLEAPLNPLHLRERRVPFARSEPLANRPAHLRSSFPLRRLRRWVLDTLRFFVPAWHTPSKHPSCFGSLACRRGPPLGPRTSFTHLRPSSCSASLSLSSLDHHACISQSDGSQPSFSRRRALLSDPTSS
jgi:hypothetical protein